MLVVRRHDTQDPALCQRVLQVSASDYEGDHAGSNDACAHAPVADQQRVASLVLHDERHGYENGADRRGNTGIRDDARASAWLATNMRCGRSTVTRTVARLKCHEGPGQTIGKP